MENQYPDPERPNPYPQKDPWDAPKSPVKEPPPVGNPDEETQRRETLEEVRDGCLGCSGCLSWFTVLAGLLVWTLIAAF
jgi:hypothetical protein